MKKICANCKYYLSKEGDYKLGLCINEKSQKRPKNLILKNDKCKEWELNVKKMY